MSHIVARIVADGLADASIGINACKNAPSFPLLAGDTAPENVTVYDVTRDGWVVRGKVPDADDTRAGIVFPLVIVCASAGDWEAGRGKASDVGLIQNGSVQILVQLYVRDVDSAEGMRDAMYLNRAIRASLILLDHAPQDSKTQLVTALLPSTNRQTPSMEPVLGDLVCVGSTLVTYPVWESTPATV